MRWGSPKGVSSWGPRPERCDICSISRNDEAWSETLFCGDGTSRIRILECINDGGQNEIEWRTRSQTEVRGKHAKFWKLVVGSKVETMTKWINQLRWLGDSMRMCLFCFHKAFNDVAGFQKIGWQETRPTLLWFVLIYISKFESLNCELEVSTGEVSTGACGMPGG
jgi:hypothetical protein